MIDFLRDHLMLLVAVAGPVLALWVAVRRLRRGAPFLFDDVSGTRVAAGADGLVLSAPDGSARELPWSGIERLAIRTTDQGPLAEDAFWEFFPVDGGAPLVVPNSADGIDALLGAASEHLEGFDYEAVIAAMGSTENRVFEVWRKA